MLTAAELHELTGYRSAKWQERWLRENGWVFVVGRDGPKVLRAYRDKLLGMESTYEHVAEPNFSMVR